MNATLAPVTCGAAGRGGQPPATAVSAPASNPRGLPNPVLIWDPTLNQFRMANWKNPAEPRRTQAYLCALVQAALDGDGPSASASRPRMPSRAGTRPRPAVRRRRWRSR